MTAQTSPVSSRLRFHLWTKLVVFTALIVVATCSTLSWFFMQRQAASLTEGLLDSGALLANHLAITSRYSVLVKDTVQVREQIAGLLAIEDIAYVIVRSADGELLGAAGKGAWRHPFTDPYVADTLSLPVALPAPPSPVSSSVPPTMRRVLLADGTPRILGPPASHADHLLSLMAGSTSPVSYYDVAVPILSASSAFDYDPALSLTFHETLEQTTEEVPKPLTVYGTVHVGISDARTVDLLRKLIWQVLVLTLVIIATGLTGVLILAHRISAPVKSLTAAASRISRGDFSVSTTPSSSDEIGDLTRVFNDMVHSLQSREHDLHELNQTLEAQVHARTEELQRGNRRLQELDHLKTSLLSNASHELRTPVTSMKVHVTNLLDGVSGPLTQDQSDTLRRVKANIERLRQMIDDLLDLSRFQTGRVTLNTEPVWLNHVIQDVLLTLHHYYSAQKNLSVQVNLPDSLCRVWGDEEKLRQVFTNLMHNAVKFTAAGGVIRITAEKTGDAFVTLCVSDSGCGIPPDELDKIFLPFYRSSNGIHVRGSGLGLSIVKELVELHRGSVRVESAVAKGSRFFVQLPVTSQSQAPVLSDCQH